MPDAKRRLAVLAAAGTLLLALAGSGCGGDDDDSIPVITGPTGPTGFSDSQGLDSNSGKGNKGSN